MIPIIRSASKLVCLDHYTYFKKSCLLHCDVITHAVTIQTFVTRLAELCPAQTMMPCQSGHETGPGANFYLALSQGAAWVMSRRIQNHEILERGSGKLILLKKY